MPKNILSVGLVNYGKSFVDPFLIALEIRLTYPRRLLTLVINLLVILLLVLLVSFQN